MIYGIGSDLVAVARIQRALDRHGDGFARRLLARSEWDAYAASPNRASMLAKRFAAKEALAKALGTGLRVPVTLANISVVHDPLGKPDFRFAPPLSAMLENRGIGRCHLSISDERDIACAFVVLES